MANADNSQGFLGRMHLYDLYTFIPFFTTYLLMVYGMAIELSLSSKQICYEKDLHKFISHTACFTLSFYCSLHPYKFLTMKIFVKNMVSLRCKIIVKEALERVGIHFVNVEMGEVEILQHISREDHLMIANTLLSYGLEVIDNNKLKMTEKIKHIIIELIHHTKEPLEINFSNYLSQRLQYDYTYLANIFSETEGMTIEKFMICHKIERVKEMLVHSELNLTQIAYKLHYSSVSHVSNQFKRVTGLTPSMYKRRKQGHRSIVEKVCGA